MTYQSLLQSGAVQRVDVQVGAAYGTISGVNSASLQTVDVGTGNVQVSVSRYLETDVDLYLIEPGGEQIYFVNKTSDAGGQLDLDSNAICIIDGVKNENITYENVSPPVGTYTVTVDYFSSCNLGDSNYVVTVQNNGVFSTFRGTLTVSDDRQEVTTFEVR